MPGHDHHWTFGDHCHIEFPGGGAPLAALAHDFSSYEGCAAFSDSGGNLLFYTDGSLIYPPTFGSGNVTGPPLGGDSSSCHAAIIVPPAGGGKVYHVFTVSSWDKVKFPPRHVHHTAVTISSGVITYPPPTPLTAGNVNFNAAEKLAAIPHEDCDTYWVVALDIHGNTDGTAVSPGTFHAFKVDSDLLPAGSVQSPCLSAYYGYCTKFSPDGNWLAMTSKTSVDIFTFSRITGTITPHSQIVGIPEKGQYGGAYGLEFSPDSLHLYFTEYEFGYIRRHTLSTAGPGNPRPYSQTDIVGQWTTPGRGNYRVGALQLGPNGKIYGTKVSQDTLFEIGDPNHGNAGMVQFAIDAMKAGGGKLQLGTKADLGLPTFTRIADSCLAIEPPADRCAALAAEVKNQLESKSPVNQMATCEGSQPVAPGCAALQLPAIRPQVYISWGSSACDCIEGDDTEVVQIRICNPYSNLNLSDMIVHRLVVVDAAGQPVASLPDGSPSIQLVPTGPHCFGDLAPCSCVTREFVLRLRGAPGGDYKLLVEGICFDACFHGDEDACFAFRVCADN